MSKVKRIRNTLQEFSLPLIFGVIFGILVANMDYDLYHHLVHFTPLGPDAKLLGHTIDLHFLINDIFMVLFFGIAAKEITESVLPGGALNPPSKAINPLLGTLGGVIGPVVFFFLFAAMFMADGVSDVGGAIVNSMTPGIDTKEAFDQNSIVFRGWGIPTATDIALAWLVAKIVFGNTHPAVNFLLLLAVADDAIGLGIIAIFYPDPNSPAAPEWLGLVALGMAVSYGFRKMNVKKWTPYIFVGGFLSWLGLLEAHLHPALALVPIVPFLPGPERDLGLFVEEEEEDHDDGHGHGHGHSPLEEFEHQLKTFVDFGLFFFAFANAGVKLDSVGMITWVILAALIVGKTVGIFIFAWGGSLMGFPLPEGMKLKHLVVAGVVAGLGLTVALFVTGEAYPSGGTADALQGPAKMGAVFSAGAGLLAIVLGKMLKVHQNDDK